MLGADGLGARIMPASDWPVRAGANDDKGWAMIEVQEIERRPADRPVQPSAGLAVCEDRVVERFLDRPAAPRSDTDFLGRLNRSLFDEPEYRPSVPSLRSLVALAVVALLAVGAAALIGTAWHDLNDGGTTQQEVR
jgi:hypothetical protein